MKDELIKKIEAINNPYVIKFILRLIDSLEKKMGNTMYENQFIAFK